PGKCRFKICSRISFKLSAAAVLRERLKITKSRSIFARARSRSTAAGYVHWNVAATEDDPDPVIGSASPTSAATAIHTPTTASASAAPAADLITLGVISDRIEKRIDLFHITDVALIARSSRSRVDAVGKDHD